MVDDDDAGNGDGVSGKSGDGCKGSVAMKESSLETDTEAANLRFKVNSNLAV